MSCARKKLRISVKKKHENLSVKTRTCFFQKVVRVLDETRTCFPESFG